MKRRKHDPKMFQSIQDRSNKGESVAALCKENKISTALFYSWRQRQKVKAAKSSKNTNATPVTTTHALDAARYAQFNQTLNKAIEKATNETAETNETETRGFLLVGSPRFLAEVMNQL